MVTIDAPKNDESISEYINCANMGTNIDTPNIICKIPSVKNTVL